VLQDRIAKRYATSLYELAAQRGETDRLLQDSQELHKLVRSSTQFVAFLESPVIVSEKKESILKRILTDKLSPAFLQLTTLLAKRHRANLLDNIATEYITIYNKHNNITIVELTTAFEADKAFEDSVADKVAKALNTKVQLRAKVDPALIGGFVLRIGDRIYDGSLQASLLEIKKQFTATTPLSKP
jgi:F-type H+-transporting ATPase subunit delta